MNKNSIKNYDETLNGRMLIRLAQEERKRLKDIIDNATACMNHLPAGQVEVKRNNKSLQFYYKEDSGVKNGVYMPVSKRDTAYGIIQRRYLERVKRQAEIQMHVLDKMLEKYDPEVLKKAFLSESPARQGIINPIVMPDQMYAELWQQIRYERKGFADDAPVHYTEKNERVRSKSEVIIANALLHAGIPYHYEKPLKIDGQIIRPDFTILRLTDRKVMYWEHLGKMDDRDYANDAIWRIREYEKIGIYPGDNLIITAETYKMQLNLGTIHHAIDHYIKC